MNWQQTDIHRHLFTGIVRHPDSLGLPAIAVRYPVTGNVFTGALFCHVSALALLLPQACLMPDILTDGRRNLIVLPCRAVRSSAHPACYRLISCFDNRLHIQYRHKSLVFCGVRSTAEAACKKHDSKQNRFLCDHPHLSKPHLVE